MTKLKMSSHRPGSILVIALVVTSVATVLAGGFATRLVSGVRVAGHSLDHVQMRMLAESAAEEVYLRLQQTSNDPGAGAYGAMRATGSANDALPIAGLDAVRCFERAAALTARTGRRVGVSTTAAIVAAERISADPGEARGLVRVWATASIAPGVNESVCVDRVFQVARTTLPPELAGFALLTTAAAPDAVLKTPAGKALCARAAANALSVLEILKRPAPEGLKLLDASEMELAANALPAFQAEGLVARAHLITRSTATLDAFASARLAAGRAINGVLFDVSGEPLAVRWNRFRGRAVIAVSGEMDIGDIELADPSSDALTLVALAGARITGRSVSAHVIAPAPDSGDVLFSRQASVGGTVIAPRFPRAGGIGREELKACQMGPPPPLAVEAYHVGFDPRPAAVDHRPGQE